jgi:hypothetical protein
VYSKSVSDFKVWAREKEHESISRENAHAIEASGSAGGVKKGKAKKLTLRQLLLSTDSGVSRFGSEIIEHCILSSGIESSTKAEDVYLSDKLDGFIEVLMKELANGVTLMTDLDRPLKPGYIVYREIAPTAPRVLSSSSTTKTTPPTDNTVSSVVADTVVEYLEFLPKLFKQHEMKLTIEVPSFHEAVDRYFCKIEDQKLEKSARARFVAFTTSIIYTFEPF